MIYISSKEIEELDEEKLRAFLGKQYRENRFLDYKQKYEKRTVDEAKEELLADVTGFANHYGGNIIIGVEELEEEGASSQPGELIGIENGDKEAEKYRNLCDNSIDPPIHGLVVKDLFLENERWAIVVYVPTSLRRPHMVTFRGKNRFHIRRDDRTVKMTTDEVKRSVVEVISLEKDMDSYVERIEEEIVEDYLENHFGLIMHAIPYLLEEDQIDTSKDEIRSILQDSSLHVDGVDVRSSFVPMPSIHGIFGAGGRTNPDFKTSIHRTGYMGLAYNIKGALKERGIEEIIIYPAVEKVFLGFLRICQFATERAKISSPYQVRCCFVNSKGAVYECSNSFRRKKTSEIIWKRDRISLPGIRLDSFKDIDDVADLLFEKLQNAFGLPYM